MQHVLRCWERQSDGSEYKKTGGRASAPDPADGAYSAPANPLVGGEGWLSLPKNPIPRSRPFAPRLSYPTPKLVPTPLLLGQGRVQDFSLGQDRRSKREAECRERNGILWEGQRAAIFSSPARVSGGALRSPPAGSKPFLTS